MYYALLFLGSSNICQFCILWFLSFLIIWEAIIILRIFILRSSIANLLDKLRRIFQKALTEGVVGEDFFLFENAPHHFGTEDDFHLHIFWCPEFSWIIPVEFYVNLKNKLKF